MSAFDEKLARWKDRAPKPRNPKRDRWFRTTGKRTSDSKFRAHVESVKESNRRAHKVIPQ